MTIALPRGRVRRRSVLLPVTLGVALLCLASLALGARGDVGLFELSRLFGAAEAADPAAIVLREMRLPRTVAGVLVGAALGMAGALMQTATRNPLADPGLLGVNAGATAGVVAVVLFAGADGSAALTAAALAGAGLTALFVYGLTALGTGPAALVLAGAAVTALIFALVRAMLLISQQALDVYRHWVLGALDGAAFATILPVLPLLGAGIAAAALTARRLDALAMGDEMGRALGVRVAPTMALSLAAISMLSAAAVAIAGPIGFVGLIVPHAARRLGAADTGALMAMSAALGAGLVLCADIAGRVILPGLAIPAGLGVALIGGPTLAVIARRASRGEP